MNRGGVRAGAGRPKGSVNRRPTVSRATEEALAAIARDLSALRQQRRDDGEIGPMVLRRLTELERLIRGGDLHLAPRLTRRRPQGL